MACTCSDFPGVGARPTPPDGAVMDLEKLLAPIREDSPTGVDLREQAADLTFQQLEQERTQVLPEDDPGGSGHEPNWEKVAAQCEDVLSTTSKDLQLAVWLAEARAHLHGFDGLHDGLSLIKELTETFWELMHPGFDPESLQLPVRARPLNWLGSSSEFVRAAASCTIVPAGGGQRALSWEDYRNSHLVDQKHTLADQMQYDDLRAAGYIDGEEWSARLGALGASELRETVAGVARCQEALGELRGLSDKLFGDDEAPSFVSLAELLLELREYLEERVPSEEEAPGQEAAGGVAGGGGSLASREEALRRLSEVAEYFRRTEPHSPVSYLVERAVRWGRMPLMDVIQEFVEDPNSLERIRFNLGIRGE